MATLVTMPVLGLTMEEGTVAEWLKQEGDAVRKDEPLLTVEMDKGTQEVPSPASGVLRRILVQVGTTVPVRTLIAEIGEPGEVAEPSPEAGGPPATHSTAGGPGDLPAAQTTLGGPPPATESAAGGPSLATQSEAGGPSPARHSTGGSSPPATESTAGGPGDLPASVGQPPADLAAQRGLTTASAGESAPSPVSAGRGVVAPGTASGGRVFSSPRARMRARALGVDLAGVQGSGPQGRIVEADVLTVGAVETRVVITPLARRLAEEHGVALTDLVGTGPGGRITQDDVLLAARQRPAPAQLVPRQPAPGQPAPGQPALGQPALVQPAPGQPAASQPGPGALQPAPVQPAPEPAPGTLQPLTRMRRITADRMAASARATARVTLFLDADFSEAARFRDQLQPEFARLGVPKLPWDALIAKAVALALAEHPAVIAQWVDDAPGGGLRQPAAANVGVAVALQPEGLVVPVLREAGARSLRELAADLLSLADKARAGRLSPAEMQGGAFTITNLGAYRVDGFTPIINPPETAILGVGRIAPKAVVIDGKLEARTMATLSLSFDHRAVDGAPAAAFLARLAELLERPYALLGI